MERRNLGSMDGRDSMPPCNLDTGDPCRYDGIVETSLLIRWLIIYDLVQTTGINDELRQ